MLKRIASAAGMVLLASSFALAGQATTTTKPVERPRVAQSQNSTTAKAASVKKHHKKHKKHHKKATDTTIKK